MMQNDPSDSYNNKVNNDPNAGVTSSSSSATYESGKNMMQNDPSDSYNNKVNNDPNASELIN